MNVTALHQVSNTKRPQAPSHLSDYARKFFDSVVDHYPMSPADVEILSQACTVMDELKALQNELATFQIGSGGKIVLDQVMPNGVRRIVPHPVAPLIDSKRQMLFRFLSGLYLTEE